MADQTPYRVPPGFGDDGRALRSNLQGSPYRKDYGPKGCAGIVLAPVVLVVALLLPGRKRR